MASETSQTGVTLRDVIDSDLPIFFEQQRDPDAHHMAGFMPNAPDDREAFMAHWAKRRADASRILRTILYDGQVVGNIMSFLWNENRAVGYYIDRVHWGKGIATQALAQFLEIETERPLHAMVLDDNIGSQRVLAKCGFVETGRGRIFSPIRGEEIGEIHMTLE